MNIKDGIHQSGEGSLLGGAGECAFYIKNLIQGRAWMVVQRSVAEEQEKEECFPCFREENPSQQRKSNNQHH